MAARAASFRAGQRTKPQCPNLGELLCVLAVATGPWEDLVVPVFHEAFDRNVLWALKQHPELVDDKSAGRVPKSFAANVVPSVCAVVFRKASTFI